jgi:FMN-dependent oxidoreductase (nitrilotriacetate monooxygenase family)
VEASSNGRKLHLLGHMCTGPTNHHIGAWRHPDSDVDGVLDAERYENLARLFERGLFDGVFFVDIQYIGGLSEDRPSALVEHGGQLYLLEPLQALAVMARVTRHLGLAATMSTTFNPPFRIARNFATLDHISKGRAAWNIVTSIMDIEARNYGMDRLPPRADRYDLADQTLEACIELWDTWGEGALKLDRESGQFADSKLVRYVNYRGSGIQVSGGLPTPRSPQGRPVFMQAGASPRGRDFAARWAEVVFCSHQEKSLMQEYYADIKRRMADDHGRQPDECRILPSIGVIAAETTAAAEEEAEYLDSLASPELAISMLSIPFGSDFLERIPPDTPVSEIEYDERLSTVGFFKNFVKTRKGDRPATLAEAAILQATTWLSPRFVGSPADVADQMQDLFESECCDGFVIAQMLMPNHLERFVELVVPELQRRGLFRTRYEGATFRENLLS